MHLLNQAAFLNGVLKTCESDNHKRRQRYDLQAFSRFVFGILLATLGVSAAHSQSTDTQAPFVVIGSPAAGSTLKGIITVSASASDNVGVKRIDLYANNVIVGSVTTSPYAFTWNTSNVADGSVALKAVV